LDYTIRFATINDLETIVEQRRAMMREIRECAEEPLETMANAFRPWLERKLRSKEYLEWLVIADDGSVAAGAGLWLLDWPPHILPSGHQGSRRAYLLNVYTAPEHRKRGLSRKLVGTVLEWTRDQGITAVSLHASRFGRPLYESLGFSPTNEMRLVL